MNDRELLSRYVENRSHDAFRQLVERHLPMVYATARRLVRDSHLAEDVAQNVFTTLVQKAAGIRPPQILSGWLYQTTRHLALHAVRSEIRRHEREQTALAMQALEPAPDPCQLNEHLEPAMDALEGADRDALVLRYLEDRSLREVGIELGVSEDAARMRVNRALERLRAGFERRGATVTSVLLATSLASSTTAVPAGLSASIAATALAGTAAGITATTLMTMNAFHAKLAAAVLVSALLSGTGAWLLFQPKFTAAEARARAARAQQEQLGSARNEALTAAEASARELESLRRQVSELPRLRGELMRLRGEAQAATAANAATAPRTNAALLVAGVVVNRIGPQVAGQAQPAPVAAHEEFVRTNIQIRVGDPFSPHDVDRDVQRLYSSGLFSNVRVLQDTTNRGVLLTFMLYEKAKQFEPGQYIPVDQISFAGYGTAESAMQSFMWALLTSNFDAMTNSFSPQSLAEAAFLHDRADFEESARKGAPSFRGMQILARKLIAEDKVQLKVRMDDGRQSGVSLYSTIKVGSEWKMQGNTGQYSPKWDTDELVHHFAP